MHLSTVTTLRALFLVALAGPLAEGLSAQTAARALLFANSSAASERTVLDAPVVRTRLAAFDASALAEPVERVRLELFPGDEGTFVLERRVVRAEGEFTWTGTLEADPQSRASFAVARGALCGTVRIGSRLVRLFSAGPHAVTVEEIDEGRVAPCLTTAAERRTSNFPPLPSGPVSSLALMANPRIDVMVVYTPQARAGQGGTAAMEALIDLAVLETNQAYQNSQIVQRLQLVHRAELPGYVEAGNWGTDLGRLYNPTDGELDYVHAWRAQCGADVVVLIEDANGGACGVAFLMGTLDPGFATTAFALVSRTCATGFYSFGHELGHVMGLAHDRDNSSDKSMRASYSSGLAQGNSPSYSPVVSALGRHVAFLSDASNLVNGDTNSVADLFLRDRDALTTTRVNVSSAGIEANGVPVSAPAISQSGAIVAFDSTATTLVAGDTNGAADVFVRDVTAGVTTRVSVVTGGGQANGDSFGPALSNDGRYVAFASTASNLVPGASGTQVYLHDRTTGTTTLVSRNTLSNAGNGVSQGPAVSGDGRFVAFTSTSSDLSLPDTNGKSDVFVRDMQLALTLRASVGAGGLEANDDSPFAPAITSDGRFIAYTSRASNLVNADLNTTWDVLVFDRTNGSNARVSVGALGVEGNGPSGWMSRPSITADGRFVAFGSRASNLIALDTNGSDDAFVRDLRLGTTECVSVTASGQLKSGHSANVDQNTTVSISTATGDVTTFVSSAVLEVIDSNGLQDAYVHRRSEPNPAGVDEYSYGYRTPNNQYRTIMSYAPGTRVQYYSNPGVSFGGFALGIAEPDQYAAEAWKTLNNTTATVAGFAGTVYQPFCAGDGSANACPCGNASAMGSNAGCLNSLSLAGSLSGIGTASLTNDTAALQGGGMPNSGALYFQGTARVAAGAGAVFGNGLLCVGGSTWRLGLKINAANASRVPSAGDPALSTLGVLVSAVTIHYQVWYRDAALFCTASGYGLTNGLSIAWSP